MATIWWAAPTGATSGSGTQANPVTLATACAGALAGDTVNLLSGNYLSFPAPAHSGIAGSLITFQNAPGAIPVIDGGLGVVAGGAGPTNLASLFTSLGTPSYPAGSSTPGNSVWRYTASGIVYGVWANDFDGTESVAAITASPTGRGCSLWNTGNEAQTLQSGNVNPDFRICRDGTGGLGQSNVQANDGNWEYRYNTATTGNTTNGGLYSQPENSLDIRLNASGSGANDAPTNYTLYAAARDWGLRFTSATNYITFSGIYFRRFASWVRVDSAVCDHITFQNCNFRYAGGKGVNLQNLATNWSFLGCKLVGCGSIIGSYEDGINLYGASRNITVDGGELAWFGDGGVTSQGEVSTGIGPSAIYVTNNLIHHGVNGLNFTTKPVNTGCKINGNTFHDCGQIGFVGVNKGTHFALQLSALDNSEVKHNILYDCGWGAYFSTQGAKQISNNKFQCNTFVDSRRNSVEVVSDSPLGSASANAFFNNLIQNNIFYGPSGSPADPGSHLMDFYWNNWMNAANGNALDHNLFYAPASGTVFQDDTGGLGPTTQYTSIETAQAAFTGLMAGGGNKTGDPLFTNYAGRDFTLQSGSPARGMGLSIDGSTDVGATPYATAVTGPQSVAIAESPSSGTAPVTVSFTGSAVAGTAGPITGWAWTFQNGAPATSNVQNPSGVVFSAVGTQAVTLTVTDSTGRTGVANNTVTVNAPVAGPSNVLISASVVSGNAQLPVNLAGSASPGSAAITTWLWNFNSTSQSPAPTGGTANTGLQTPNTLVYGNNNALGGANVVYTVTLRVTDANGNFADATPVTITVTPALTPNSTTIHSALPATQVAWSSANGAQTGEKAFDALLSGTSYWEKDPTVPLDATNFAWLRADLTGQSGVRRYVDQLRTRFLNYPTLKYNYQWFHYAGDDATIPPNDARWVQLTPILNSALGVEWTIRATTNSTLNGGVPVTTRFLQLRLSGASDVNNVSNLDAGVWETYVYDKTDPNSTLYPFVAWIDDGPARAGRGNYGPDMLLLNQDATNCIPTSRWLWNGALPVNLIGDLNSPDKSIGRLRIYPYKARQGWIYTVNVAVQTNANVNTSNWTPVLTGATTATTTDYTDLSWTPQNLRKVRVTFTAVNKGVQIGLWGRAQAFGT